MCAYYSVSLYPQRLDPFHSTSWTCRVLKIGNRLGPEVIAYTSLTHTPTFSPAPTHSHTHTHTHMQALLSNDSSLAVTLSLSFDERLIVDIVSLLSLCCHDEWALSKFYTKIRTSRDSLCSRERYIKPTSSLCVCVCLYMCGRERARERERCSLRKQQKDGPCTCTVWVGCVAWLLMVESEILTPIRTQILVNAVYLKLTRLGAMALRDKSSERWTVRLVCTMFVRPYARTQYTVCITRPCSSDYAHVCMYVRANSGLNW